MCAKTQGVLALLSPSCRHSSAFLRPLRQVPSKIGVRKSSQRYRGRIFIGIAAAPCAAWPLPLKIISGGCSGRRHWRQRDRIAQLLEASDVLALEPCRIALVPALYHRHLTQEKYRRTRGKVSVSCWDYAAAAIRSTNRFNTLLLQPKSDNEMASTPTRMCTRQPFSSLVTVTSATKTYHPSPN